ncbi:hypothetical protein Cme02nite_56400 [Catellatospora methionotrophica]|uniref:Uncharacterized protein n=1 Tax=Catellatospora methionotrophica TaxID=121620 RepID=A0A8J3LFF8_9ACTN|nr:hypothetical protein Cme02nite_56400 [Catellatospora methionotrophica]
MSDLGTQARSSDVDRRQFKSHDLDDVFESRIRASRERVDLAVALAAQHRARLGICSCFRPLPCGVLAVLEEQHAVSEASVAALLGPTRVMTLAVPAAREIARPRPKRTAWWPFVSRPRIAHGRAS